MMLRCNVEVLCVKHWCMLCMSAGRGSQEYISCTMWWIHACHMTANIYIDVIDVCMTCVLRSIMEVYMFQHVS